VTRDAEDERWMARALDRARAAIQHDDVPVGAIVVYRGREIAGAENTMVATRSALAHAEMESLRAAQRALDAAWLSDCTLYVTLEPCAMCAGAIVLARVARLVFGAWDEKAGMCGSVGDLVRNPRLNHSPEVRAGVLEAESAALLQEFFAGRRIRSDRP
jgi:tRNA(adenine34) deaminase